MGNGNSQSGLFIPSKSLTDQLVYAQSLRERNKPKPWKEAAAAIYAQTKGVAGMALSETEKKSNVEVIITSFGRLAGNLQSVATAEYLKEMALVKAFYGKQRHKSLGIGKEGAINGEEMARLIIDINKAFNVKGRYEECIAVMRREYEIIKEWRKTEGSTPTEGGGANNFRINEVLGKIISDGQGNFSSLEEMVLQEFEARIPKEKVFDKADPKSSLVYLSNGVFCINEELFRDVMKKCVAAAVEAMTSIELPKILQTEYQKFSAAKKNGTLSKADQKIYDSLVKIQEANRQLNSILNDPDNVAYRERLQDSFYKNFWFETEGAGLLKTLKDSLVEEKEVDINGESQKILQQIEKKKVPDAMLTGVKTFFSKDQGTQLGNFAETYAAVGLDIFASQFEAAMKGGRGLFTGVAVQQVGGDAARPDHVIALTSTGDTGDAQKVIQKYVESIAEGSKIDEKTGDKKNRLSREEMVRKTVAATESIGDMLKKADYEGPTGNFLIYINQKHYTIASALKEVTTDSTTPGNKYKGFAGYSAGAPIELDFFCENVASAVMGGMDVRSLRGALLQLSNGAIAAKNKDITQGISAGLAGGIAYALFDDYTTIGTEVNVGSQSVNMVHILDLNGALLPLSFVLNELAAALRETEKSFRDVKRLVTVQILPSTEDIFSDYHNVSGEWETEWREVSERVAANTKLKFTFLKNISALMSKISEGW